MPAVSEWYFSYEDSTTYEGTFGGGVPHPQEILGNLGRELERTPWRETTCPQRIVGLLGSERYGDVFDGDANRSSV
jgi:hypothetical protein